MRQPNQLKQAEKELKSFDLGDFKIPKKIQDAECQSYVCICIKSKDNAQGTGKIHASRICYATEDKWKQMKAEVEVKRVSGMFGGLFQMVVILHNPTLPNVEEKKADPKPLSPTQKSQVNAMMEEGKGQDNAGLQAIAKELDIEFDRIKAYIASH